MISMPLKYIYSADLQPSPSWRLSSTSAFGEINSYMSYFDMAYTRSNKVNPDGVEGVSLGSFSRSFADLKQLLTVGFGFASQVNIMDATGTGSFTQDSTYYFPRYNEYGDTKVLLDLGRIVGRAAEAQYSYHFTDNGEWITTATAPDPKYDPFSFGPRGTAFRRISNADWENTYGQNPGLNTDSRFRFIYEEEGNYNETTGTFTVTLPASGETRIVGNPLMSHIDFNEFASLNQAVINPYYRIWDGTKFYIYSLLDTYDESVWQGMDGLSSNPETEDTGASLQYIAPMQAFFVDMVDPNAASLSLTFNKDVSTAKASSADNYQLKADPQPEKNNLLKVRLKMNEVETLALLASLSGASDGYNMKEDIYKLFSYDNATPEIYTVADETAIEINAVSQEGGQKLIPLGIKTDQTGTFELSIEGAEAFNAYESVRLLDALSGESYDLKEQTSFTFEKTAAENLEGRLYISLEGPLLSVETIDSEDPVISIVRENAWVKVYSPVDAINHFEVYDVSGRLSFKDATIGASSYSWNPGVVPQGIYLVKVQSGLQTKVLKIEL